MKQFSPIKDPEHYAVVNELYDRALEQLSGIPELWLEYAKFSAKQHRVTETRKIYDRALGSLPVTDHDSIWDAYLQWAESLEGLTDTACHIYRRYLKFKPEHTELYIDYLLKHDLLEEALELYLYILDDEGFVSVKGKTKYQFWMELCEFISKNPDRCRFKDP